MFFTYPPIEYELSNLEKYASLPLTSSIKIIIVPLVSMQASKKNTVDNSESMSW